MTDRWDTEHASDMGCELDVFGLSIAELRK
jgi:hypothetical protein